jgi:hypothetical protein
MPGRRKGAKAVANRTVVSNRKLRRGQNSRKERSRKFLVLSSVNKMEIETFLKIIKKRTDSIIPAMTANNTTKFTIEREVHSC